MTRTDRRRAEVRRLVPGGDTPEFRAAFAAFMASSERDMHPWWERAAAWYMRLPHNRRMITPALRWAGRHPKVTWPLACAALAAEILLLR